VSIKINEPYSGHSIFSEYMLELTRMSDEELIDEYSRFSGSVTLSEVDMIKKKAFWWILLSALTRNIFCGHNSCVNLIFF
jgi:hypothetical protein